MDQLASQASDRNADTATYREMESKAAVSSYGLMVRRTRLLRDLKIRSVDAGVTIVCAPDGMGKTALLLEYVAEVKNDPARGSARLLDARSMDVEQLYMAFRRLPEELPLAMHPLVAVDNMPEFGRAALEAFPELLRELRSRGVEFILACKPSAHGLAQVMGDSYKIGAQALVVRPREYPDWTHAFSIDQTLDVYELTQGVPSLVVALRSFDGERPDAVQLERATVELYRTLLEDLRRGHDSLYRLACLLVLTGEGAFASLAKTGMRVRDDSIARLARDYPVFGIDAERKQYACMGMRTKGMEELRESIAKSQPVFAKKALQILMAMGKVDQAVELVQLMHDDAEELEFAAAWPVHLAISANARFVNRVVSRLDAKTAASAPVGLVLAVYAAALVTGEYRMARSMAAELHRRATDLKRDIDDATLSAAYALSSVWRDCPGVALPELPVKHGTKGRVSIGGRLASHGEALDAFLTRGNGAAEEIVADALGGDPLIPMDLSMILLHCDELLYRAFHGDVGDVLVCDKRLQKLADKLRDRKAGPFAEYVRMTAAVCRLTAGMPVVDERAFVDPGNAAVRAAHLPLQLFCLLGEGWQAIDLGQVVNARFRAQQVLRLAEPRQELLVEWATMLERSAYIINSAQITLGEDASAVDLSQARVTPAEAWSVALLLSAAGYVSELSAWYSLHKTTLLDSAFRPMARQAMRAVGERADALRYLLPAECALQYETDGLETSQASRALAVRESLSSQGAQAGQVVVKLFGGFRIERNGHVLTEALWRRKRLCALTSRLILSLGSFVDRRVLTEEMWPESEYIRARENLYTVLSTLRSALGQQQTGPRYILTQGEGVAINGEYVISDVARFDMLARDILLRRTGTSGREIIESCLKMEEVYAGPLYVADLGNSAFHQRMRRIYSAKFVDCMLRGVDAALGLDDLPSASWLIEAAKREAPYREDVMRQAMRIYDRCGRRREIVEMYNAHMHYLKHVAHALPEEETRLAYEAIMGKDNRDALL